MAGLLGMGGFGMGQNVPKSLLGEFYDPEEMRKQQIKQMLIGAGLGLMSDGNLAGAGKGALQFGSQAQENYMDQAMLGYKMSQAEQDRAFDMEEREAKKAEKEQWNNYVSTLPVHLQPALRANPGLIDDYVKATSPEFQQYEPPKAPQMETIYDEQGRAQKVQWDQNANNWVPVGGAKPDDNGIIIENADGTRTIIGGKGGGKMTESDYRAKLLVDQIVQQEPEIMAGFDTLAKPQNYVGSQVPGGTAMMTPPAQIAEDGIKNVVANWLYLTSGATATDAEVERQFSIIRPSPLDAPDRVAAKKARLQMILDTMKVRGGIQPQAAPAPDAATTVDGFTIRKVK